MARRTDKKIKGCRVLYTNQKTGRTMYASTARERVGDIRLYRYMRWHACLTGKKTCQSGVCATPLGRFKKGAL